MVVATSVPYLWNFATTPSGYHYTWILPPYPADSFGYMAWTRQAANGALLFKVKFTALPQSAFLFHPFFLICGWLTRLFDCEIGAIHLAVKEVGVILFFLAFYRYADYLRLNEFQSLIASVLLGISSGFGGLFALAGWVKHPSILPADLWMPEMSTYWSLLWNPLFPYSLLLLLLTIYFLDRGTRESRSSDLWFAGLAAGVLALIHPYSQPLLLAFAVCVVVVRKRTRGLGYLLRYLAVLSPFLLYVVLLSVFQPILAQHSARGAMSSPRVIAYILGFGLPLLLWAAGFAVGWGRWMKQYWQIVLWFVLSLGLAYFPFWFQRKLIFGAHIPLCILAAISFDLILGRCSNPRIRKLSLVAAVVVLLPLLAVTPIYQVISGRTEVQDNTDGAYYISNQMLDALNFLRHASKPSDIVLATPQSGRFITAFSGNTVLWGHWAMSVDYNQRKEWYKRLFNEPQDWENEQRSRDFWGSGIEYIFADAQSKTSIEREPVKWHVILRDSDEIFRNGEVVIYKHKAG